MGSIPLVFCVEAHVKGFLGGGGGGSTRGENLPPPLKVALPPEMDYDQFYHISKSHNTGQSRYKASHPQF